jgi:TRAP-type C4-dicarboxylate transport system substrate-binding protein
MLPDMLLISTPIWQSLTKQEQDWLQKAADESSHFQRELWATKTEADLDAVRKLGVEVHLPDKASFMKKVAPMYDAYQGTPIGELVKDIRELK